ncbi:MAG: DNA primase noncatalytic subunit PriX [Candidatus Micrarchaeia archaeon]
MPDDLDFAYKYPFSEEAKSIVSALNITKVEKSYLDAAKIRLEEDFAGKAEFLKTGYSDLKKTYLVSYAFARLLVSVMGAHPIKLFAEGEAKRILGALVEESEENILRISKELGCPASIEGKDFKIAFYDYLKVVPNDREEFALIHQNMRDGFVYLNKYAVVQLLAEAAKKKVLSGLPIKSSEIPKEVSAYAKSVKQPRAEVAQIPATQGKRYGWIEQLLNTPIPDFRHRVVNLVLAPYLTNIRGLSEEEAFSIIYNYIQRCKEINPNTKINEAYIRYQCAYAKKKGMRPLSLARAKELMAGIIDFSSF